MPGLRFFVTGIWCLLGALPASRAFAADARATEGWMEIVTVEDVCARWPDRVRALMDALDLDRPALAGVRRGVDRGDPVAACDALLAYYRDGGSAAWLRRDPPTPSDERDPAADVILADTFTHFGETGTVPRRDDGGRDWTFRGPANDPEWAWGLNRHIYMITLLDAWAETGNPVYARTIDRDIRDWIAHGLPYPGKLSNTAMWRGLEATSRAKRWARAFFELQDCDELRPGTRLLLLTSIPEHADYLRRFHSHGNWAAMELSALATIAAAWPEYADAPEWRDYAVGQLLWEMNDQVYPDGVQTELTANYHWVTVHNFGQVANLRRDSGDPPDPVFDRRIEQMWDYLARVMRPDGSGPLNNDTHRIDLTERVVEAAAVWDRPDWLYIATNGREGAAPEGPPSALFPWAGQLIMRDGFGPTAQWGFFDAGPWGTGHQHNDKLHLSIHAGGRDLLVDSGKFAYSGDLAARFRPRYVAHSVAHNVLLFDGGGQKSGPRRATEPLAAGDSIVTDGYDFARSWFDRFNVDAGTVRHERAVLYVRGRFWVVCDRVETDRPRRVEAPWHWHPACTIEIDGCRAESVDPATGNLAIVPVGELDWRVDMVRGREGEQPQGWYSPSYGVAEPSPVSVYTAEIPAGCTTFAWVLVPATGAVPPVRAGFVDPAGDAAGDPAGAPEGGAGRIRVEVGDDARYEVAAPPQPRGGIPSARRME